MFFTFTKSMMRKTNYFILVALSIMALTACKKDKTSWNSKYKVVLVNDTLRLDNIVKDSLFADDGTGNLKLFFEKELLNFDFSNAVSIPDTVIVQKYSVSVNTYTVQPGFNFVNNVKDHTFDLKGAKLTFAGIKSGEVMLEVQNPYPTTAIFDVSLPKVKKGGIALSRKLTVSAGTQANPTKATVKVDVSDYDIDLTGTTGTGFNNLQSTLKITADPNGTAVQVTKYDTTNFKITFKDLKVNRAKGYFGNQKAAQSFDEQLAFFDKVSGLVAIEDYNLRLVLENSCKLEGMLKIAGIYNKNNSTGTSVALQHSIINNPVFVQSATGNWQSYQPFVRTFDFLPTNSNLSDFIGNLGSQFYGNLEIQLNPNGDTYSGWNELFADSYIKVKLKADMPLKIKLENLIFRDTFDFQLNNSTDKTHLKQGQLILEAINAYPIDLWATFDLLDENNQLVGTISSSEKLKSSTESSLTVNGLSCSKSQIHFAVTEEVATQLVLAKKIVVRLTANTYSNSSGSIPAVTTLPYNGFVTTKIYGDFGVKFKL